MKIGDIVYLKSGSVAMTVANTDGNHIICTWFNASGFKEIGLHQDQLTSSDTSDLV